MDNKKLKFEEHIVDGKLCKYTYVFNVTKNGTKHKYINSITLRCKTCNKFCKNELKCQHCGEHFQDG